MIQVKVKIPKELVNTRVLKDALKNARAGAALACKADFGVTTQTWKHQPEFVIKETWSGTSVATTDQRYKWINDGTKPYIIMPKKGQFLVFRVPFRAKTSPGKIRSRKGGVGKNVVFARMVRHPGIAARNFDTVIQEKWLKEFPRIVQRAIDSVVEVE